MPGAADYAIVEARISRMTDAELVETVAALTAVAAAVQPNAAAAQMRWINLVIPSLLTLWMVWKLSAGIGLYWAASTGVGLLQSAVLRRQQRR
jgi:YidC/Oxa1 family membrane protein insertase